MLRHATASLTPWLEKVKRYRKTIENMALFSGSTSIAQVLMMVYAILLARSLGPEQYGVFAGAYSITGLSSFVVSWGMDIWMLRSSAGRHSPRALAGAVLRAKLWLGAVWGSALVIAVPLIKPDVFTPLLIAVCVLDAWSESFFITHTSALNIERRMGAVSRLVLFSRAGRLLGAVVLIFFGQASPLYFAAGRAVFTVAGLVAAFWVVRPDFQDRLSIPLPGLLRQSLPFGVSEFLALIYAQADVTILLLMAGKLATGIYSPASGLINALFVIPSTGYLMAIPYLSRLKEQDPARFPRVAMQIIALFGAAGLGMALLTGLSGSWVVWLLLGRSYQETSGLLVTLSPILLLKSIEFGLAAALVAVNWQQKRLGPQFFAALANILLNIWVIPRFQVYGVAWVYVATEVLLAAGYALLLRRWFLEQRKGAAA